MPKLWYKFDNTINLKTDQVIHLDTNVTKGIAGGKVSKIL